MSDLLHCRCTLLSVAAAQALSVLVCCSPPAYAQNAEAPVHFQSSTEVKSRQGKQSVRWAQSIPAIRSGLLSQHAEESLRKGDLALEQGDVETAKREYQNTAAQIGNDSKAQLLAAPAIAARFIEVAKKSRDADVRTEQLRGAARQYQTMIDLGATEQGKLLLGRLYLDMPSDSKGVRDGLILLEDIRLDQVPQEQRFAYEYNLGLAHQRNGNRNEALQYYKLAATSQPAFDTPGRRGFEMLREQETPDFATAHSFGDSLVDAGLGALSADEAITCLELPKWRRSDSAVDLLAVAVHYFGRVRLTPPKYQELYAGRLNVIHGEGDASQKLKRAISELNRAFAPDFDARADWSKIKSELFPTWAGSHHAKHLSAVLANTGDFVMSSGSAERHGVLRAAASYAAAWMVNNRNFDAALSAARLLQSHDWPDEERQVVTNRLLNALIANIVKEKNELYKKVPPVEYRLDWGDEDKKWSDVLRFHLLLGNIFEREEKWDPIDDLQSAVFQWTLGIRAAQRIGERQTVAALRERLGLALHRAGERERALQEFKLSIDEFLELDEHGAAAHAFMTQVALELGDADFAERTKDGLLKGGDERVPIAYAGRIVAGPAGVLCVSDPSTGNVFCFDALRAGLPERAVSLDDLNVENLRDRIADRLRVEPKAIRVPSIAIQPKPRQLLLSVNIVQPERTKPFLVAVGPDSDLKPIPLRDLPGTRISQPNTSDVVYLPGHVCTGVFFRGEGGIGSLRLNTTPREQPGPPVLFETWNPRNQEWTSDEWLRVCTTVRIRGELFLAGCTSRATLILIPAVELRPGQTVRARTLVYDQTGQPDMPSDLIALEGEDRSAPVLILSTRHKGVTRIDLASVPVPIPANARLNVPSERLSTNGQVVGMASYDAHHFVMLTISGARMSLESRRVE